MLRNITIKFARTELTAKWTTTKAIMACVSVMSKLVEGNSTDKKIAAIAKTKAVLPTNQWAQLKIGLK